MHRISSYCLAVVLIALFPLTVLAMSHEQDQVPQQATEQNHDHSQHDSMATPGDMFIVGDTVSDDVRGMAHLKDVQAAMEKMGMKATHHFMAAFIDVQTGQQIESGKVALKVKGPDGKTSDPIELVGMQGHFGADVVLDKPGVYHFNLGTKLADGVTRSFHFHHQIK